MAEQDEEMRASKGTRLGRWSERKLEVKAQERAPLQRAEQGAPDDAGAKPDDDMPELPDIETLDKDSDFSPFMDARVPEELQRLALRKLWASDPVYANLDGLNDYDPGQMKFLEQISETAQQIINKALREQDAAEDAAADEGEAAGDVAGEENAAEPLTAEAAPAPQPQRPRMAAEYSDVEDMDDPDEPGAS